MATPERIVLASANPKKVAELRAILDAAELDVELLARPDDVPEVVEDAPDFIGNARLKARALMAATGEWALADDSGLQVDALDGAPGVRSARYAGESASDVDNVTLLLAELDRVGVASGSEQPVQSSRSARFRCVIVLAGPDGSEVVAEGTVEGHIA
ncbi:MAG: non-canonical purine NTP pyrophosphatase, partial [Microthrixaceae bacterium]